MAIMKRAGLSPIREGWKLPWTEPPRHHLHPPALCLELNHSDEGHSLDIYFIRYLFWCQADGRAGDALEQVYKPHNLWLFIKPFLGVEE